jgi:hypothetical protein
VPLFVGLIVRDGALRQVIITTAGTLWTRGAFPDDSANFNTIPQFANALTKHLGTVRTLARPPARPPARERGCDRAARPGPGQGALLSGHDRRRHDWIDCRPALRGLVRGPSGACMPSTGRVATAPLHTS